MAQAGDLFGGRYRIIAELGHGGMATVYRARDEKLDRDVALKVIRRDFAEDAAFIARFQLEAYRAASMSHPNVVAVYDYGTDDGRAYMVLELVDGTDLAKLIREHGRLDPRRAARIARDVSRALSAAHRKGIVHRDVKPGNILIGREGEVKVGDFGIARAIAEDSMTGTGEALGSVEYFSPEQARGERASKRSDIYSQGVVLWEMLAGHRPFTGDSPWEVAVARLSGPPPDIRGVRPDVPAGLADVVGKAMRREPAKRYATANAMEAALEPWTRTAPERKERRQAALPIAALAIVAVMVGIGYIGGPAMLALVSGDHSTEPSPHGTAIAGVLAATPSPMPSPQATPKPRPSPSATPRSTPIATPRPTAVPAPTEIAPATPQPPPPPTPQPTAQAVVVAAAQPVDSVVAFYNDVARHRFDRAYALWDSRMRADYPRRENLDERFGHTTAITIHSVHQTARSGSTARVAIDFTEYYDSGSARRFIGSWDLVLVEGRWLLDHPYF